MNSAEHETDEIERSGTDCIKRVCVIGAGPSGLTCLRALQKLDEQKFEVICYERYDSIGGEWNFNGKEGLEEDGLETHSAMYYNLTCNGCKEGMELPELRFPSDDPDLTGFPCYPDREYILKYLNTFADKFNLRPIMFFKFPISLRFYAEGLRLLLIGAGDSSEDISIMVLKEGAQYVTIAYKYEPLDRKFPDGIDQKPLVNYIRNDTVTFIDGSERSYDVIIYCTGYKYEFPFLEERLRLKTSNRMVPPLYKQIVFPEYPKLHYLGMQEQYYTFTMFWLQSHLSADIIMGHFTLPSLDEMRSEIEQAQKEEENLSSDYDSRIDFQTAYVNELSQLTGQVSVDIAHLMHREEADKRRDISTYKQQTHFKSIFWK
ncbi:trimethylamine monooxygenase-like [Symsagittifera roscoffensis]|uniref:trimethylamine monooxygenase-like n=1 Tax=Symsagittifera roscoffensis TaxID=84072 RepID=UPI00307C2BAE